MSVPNQADEPRLLRQDAPWWLEYTNKILDLLERRVAALHWIDALAPAPQSPSRISAELDPCTRMASGFLATIGPCMSFISAGHVLAEFDRDTTPPRRLIKASVTAGSRHRSSYIDRLVNPHLCHLRIIDQFDDGIDYGAFCMPHHVQEALHEDGALPFSMEEWTIEPIADPLYVVLWFPTSARSLTSRRTGNATQIDTRYGMPLLPCYRIAEPPDFMVKPNDRLFLRIYTHDTEIDERLRDIVGMSGGPVLELKRVADGLRMRLVGIQCGWDKETYTLSACYAAPFFYALRSHYVQMKLEGLLGYAGKAVATAMAAGLAIYDRPSPLPFVLSANIAGRTSLP